MIDASVADIARRQAREHPGETARWFGCPKVVRAVT